MWSKAGTIAVVLGSTMIQGTGTDWVNEDRGHFLWIRGEELPHEIAAITSDTSLTVLDPVELPTSDGLDFRIIPTQGLTRELSDRIAAMITLHTNAREAWDAVFTNFSTTAYALWQSQPGNEAGSVTDFLDAITGPIGPSAYEEWVALPENADQTFDDFINTLSANAVAATASHLADSTQARDTTLGYRNEAQSHATTAATEAANALSAVTWQDLSGLNVTLAGTWTGGMFYDTALDSDGGAWRAKNSTDFPVVVAVTRDADEVVLWDALDGSEYDRIDLTGYTVTSVSARNGLVHIGTSTGVVVLNYTTGETDVALTYTAATTPALVNASVLSLTQTVAPDAPIDDETGLPLVTTVVGTEDGLTILNGPAVENGPPSKGLAVDITYTGGSGQIHFMTFREDGALVYAGDIFNAAKWAHVWHSLPVADVAEGSIASQGTSDEFYGRAGTTADLFVGGSDDLRPTVALANSAIGRESQINFILPNPHSPTDGSQIIMRNDGISPVMHGATLGAWLASTDDTDLVGGNAVPNGDFLTDIAGWVAHNAVISWDAGKLVVDDTANAGSNSAAYRSFPVDEGATYKVTMDVESTTSSAFLYISEGGWLVSNEQPLQDLPAGVHETYVVAGASEIWLGLVTGGTGVTAFNSVLLERVDLDVSPNANHARIIGTIPATKVAPGADLAGFGPFSITNRPEIDNSSIFNVGIGDFTLSTALKTSAFNDYVLDTRNDNGSVGLGMHTTGAGKMNCFVSGGGTSSIQTVGDVTTGDWIFIDFVCSNNGTIYTTFLNGAIDNQTAEAARDLTGIVDPAQIGARFDSLGPLNGQMALLSFASVALTPDQIRIKHAIQSRWFKPDAKVTWSGSVIRDVFFDKPLNRYHILTDTHHVQVDARTYTVLSEVPGNWSHIVAHNGMVLKG